MCELGGSEYCRGKTHGTGVGIALQPAIATTVETAVHSRGRGKVTTLPALKTNQKGVHVHARKKSAENAAGHRR
jgi:hypothetical protein